MEVASATATVLLHSSTKQSLPKQPPRRSLMTSSNGRTIASEETGKAAKSNGTADVTQHTMVAGSPALRVDVDSGDVSRIENSEQTSPETTVLMTPTSSREEQKELNTSGEGPSPSGSSDAGHAGTEDGKTAKRGPAKKTNGLKSTEEEHQRKPNRVTRNREDPNEVVNNYVDSKDLKQPRIVRPPVGGRRTPYILPLSISEKEKDKLKIHMVGPAKKHQDEIVVAKGKPTRKPNTINQGYDYQADIPGYRAPVEITDGPLPFERSLQAVPDRDELVWRDDPVRLKGKERELDEAWKAIRRQSDGKIGLDAMMHRLMKCNYDIDEMLRTIEMEQFERLPQPFKDLNCAQQAEFERLLRKPGHANGKHKEGEKNFRMIQEKFLKTHYMGEIVNYYYSTKRRGCIHQLYTRCNCKESLVNDIVSAPRSECFNCTRYLWKEVDAPPRTPIVMCTVCEYYYARTRKQRKPQAHLTQFEEEFARTWRDLEQSKGTSQTRSQVLFHIEEQRRALLTAKVGSDELPVHQVRGKPTKYTQDDIANLTRDFKALDNPKCSLLKPWGHVARARAKIDFSDHEILEIVKCFSKLGVNFELIAAEVSAFRADEIEHFYSIYKDKYRLDKLCKPQKSSAASSSHLPSSHQQQQQQQQSSGQSPATAAADRSTSSTPEPPQGRRKRGSMADPSYAEPRRSDTSLAPPPVKTTRSSLKRQSATGTPVGPSTSATSTSTAMEEED